MLFQPCRQTIPSTSMGDGAEAARTGRVLPPAGPPRQCGPLGQAFDPLVHGRLLRRFAHGAGLDELEQVLVERVLVRGGQAVRRARIDLQDRVLDELDGAECQDRKSTRLNSSHVKISYAVFCLKKKRQL